MQLSIRKANPAEAGALCELARAAKRTWGYDEAFMARWRHLDSLTAAFIEANCVCCAIVDGKLAGFYALGGGGETVEMKHLWVHPDHIAAGSGVGRRLFEHARAAAAESGASTLLIKSEPHAEGFYRRMGARRVGSAPGAAGLQQLPVYELPLLGDTA